jgi:protein-tyrosine phosphatase
MARQKILFVCYGNTCRSPMAEGIAKKILGKSFAVESAGTSPLFDGAQPDAVRAVAGLFGVDIAGHRTRSVAEVPLELFSYIIPLDLLVAAVLKRRYRISSIKLMVWEIDDPYGGQLADYQKCARILEGKIRELKMKLEEPDTE